MSTATMPTDPPPQTGRSADRPVVLIWRSLGPYHVARARAAGERLAAEGYRVVLLELTDAEDTRDWQLARGGLPVETRTLRPGLVLDDRTPGMAAEMRRFLDALRPTHVVVAGYDRSEMREALAWAHRHGAGAILMSETKWDDKPRPAWKRWLAARMLRPVQAGLVSGAASGEYLISLGIPRERIFRQYGAVDNAYFARVAADPACPRPEAAPPGPYFMASSRLIEQRKNLVRLLDAYAQYRADVEAGPWSLVLCGDGADRAMLESHVRRNGIEGVVFTGFQQVDVLARFYAHAACFVHTATQEAWGLVVNEALAAGLPVLVSSRCGCAYDLVHEGVNGFTFDPFRTVDIADAMRRVHRLEPAERARMGTESQRIVARFGPERFAEGLRQAMHACHSEQAQDSEVRSQVVR